GAILAQRMPENLSADAPVLLVPDTVRALGQIAAHWRQQSSAKVIGVSGTAGKTTVKEILAQLLSLCGTTARNPLNLNNQIGLPLSILNTTGTEEFWVLEAGISQPQDMDELGTILRPDLAIILNAGIGHAEGLGARKIPYYKAQLLKYLSHRGLGLVSADYPELVRECRSLCQNLYFFSADGKQVTYRAAYSGPAEGSRGLYRLWLDGMPLDVEAPFRGRYGAENIIAAAAAADMLGMSRADIAAGFANACLPIQRFANRIAGPWLIIDDSYNANPLSCRRMLEAAVETAQGSPLVCVMGEMGELGEVAEAEHEQLGRLLAAALPKAVFWKGDHREAVLSGLKSEHYFGEFIPVESPEEFCRAFASLDLAGGLVLFKGSRFNCLEDFVKAFENRECPHAL
ncbi:MAG: Mur ligase family protein, partial [Desulfovibrionaceae bacterium]|nr:Mur ligase family protein [Desulfovibrionaceae bacterium]